MAQKSITSFFKPKTSAGDIEKENKEGLVPPTKEKAKTEKLPDNLRKNEEGLLVEDKEVVKNEKQSEVEDTVKSPKTRSNKTSEAMIIDTKLSLDTKSDVDEVNYDPCKENYHPLKDAYWREKAKTPYLALARTFQVIEETKGRLKMINALSNFFCSVMLITPEDLVPCVYLSINQLAPAYEGLELGVAETTLMKAICKATGRSLSQIKSQTHEIGDLGIVAEQSRVSQRMMCKPAPLSVIGVYKKLMDISKTTGPSKINMIYDVFVACRFSEARFFIRSLLGKLRIGIAEQSMINALALALVKKNHLLDTKTKNIEVHKDEIEKTTLTLRTAFCQCPNYNLLLPTLLKHSIAELTERCPMHPGMPLRPMLAQPTKGVYEVLERFSGMEITSEWKYDGERAQIHCNEKGEIFIYSRNQENNTLKYPDVTARSEKFNKGSATSYIIDSEIVAWDVERKQILPFQVLTTRKRKNVDINEIKVQVCVYVFDLLYINGSALVTEPLAERRKQLLEHFNEVEGEWHFATSLDTNDMEEVQQFLEESIKGNCEGLMVKSLNKDATYEIARRSRNWLKLKKDYLNNVGDSLDLVVIGGYRGKGKRTGMYGGFLLACYDAENEEYQSICKIGTGFTDENLRDHYEFLKNHITTSAKSYYRFDSTLAPDDWFEPVQVWEIKCADLSLSPIHKAAIGIVDNERGISLRFPRFMRVRDDKTPENATDAQQVAEMYSSQDQIKNNKAEPMDVESEFY